MLTNRRVPIVELPLETIVDHLMDLLELTIVATSIVLDLRLRAKHAHPLVI